MNTFRGNMLPAVLLLGSTLMVSACNAAPGNNDRHSTDAAAAAPVPSLAEAASTLPLMTVHKSPDCGCCGVWVEHARKAGFPVRVNDTDDMLAIKQRLGIPGDMLSCHTVEVDGYVVEGHVPIEDIQRLLSERPKARGLLLPGMPVGSPGMESPDGYRQPFTVALLLQDGELSRFADHP